MRTTSGNRQLQHTNRTRVGLCLARGIGPLPLVRLPEGLGTHSNRVIHQSVSCGTQSSHRHGIGIGSWLFRGLRVRVAVHVGTVEALKCNDTSKRYFYPGTAPAHREYPGSTL